MAFDVIVVGVGGMGRAAVYHLARRGSKVLSLAQFPIPHEMGSYPQVAMAAALSLYGFKFCSVAGEIMADLVLDGRTRFDIDMFRLRRSYGCG